MKIKMILPALMDAKSPYRRPIEYSLFPPLGLPTLAAYCDPDGDIDRLICTPVYSGQACAFSGGVPQTMVCHYNYCPGSMPAMEPGSYLSGRKKQPLKQNR